MLWTVRRVRLCDLAGSFLIVAGQAIAARATSNFCSSTCTSIINATTLAMTQSINRAEKLDSKRNMNVLNIRFSAILIQALDNDNPSTSLK